MPMVYVLGVDREDDEGVGLYQELTGTLIEGLLRRVDLKAPQVTCG
jgi:hypothetical protein